MRLCLPEELFCEIINLRMYAELEQQAPESAQGALPTAPETRRNLYTAGALSGVAALATASELVGATPDMSQTAEITFDSIRHPAVGYLGAWAATAFFKRLDNIRTKVAVAGATVANFAIESAQSLSPLSTPEYAAFLSEQNMPETGKDYAFALAGLALFMYQNRRKST